MIKRASYKLLLIFAPCLFCALVAAWPVCSHALALGEHENARQSAASMQGRLRPPSTLSCERNETTSFTGRVLAYSRTARSIFIRVRTDEETTEQFTIKLRRGQDASEKFLLNGEAFKTEDWEKIETGRGRLKRGMRATIWACRINDQFRADAIDWRPGEGEGSYVL